MKSRFEQKIKFLIKDLLPPLLTRLLIKFRNHLSRSHTNQSKNEVILENADEALYERNDKAFLFSIENVRYHGGQAYNGVQHHFLRYYAGGMRELERFYDKHQPTNVYEKHFINQPPPQCSGHENLDSRKRILISDVPWAPLNAFKSSGEHGLHHSHGVQQYGPVSTAKITLEANRLDAVLDSIKQKGFLSRYGFARGYLLEKCSGNYKFVVTGCGQHRMAALAFLGEKKVSVVFQPQWPRVIKRSDVHKWPHVLAGNISHEDALRIFDSYFRSDDLPLW